MKSEGVVCLIAGVCLSGCASLKGGCDPNNPQGLELLLCGEEYQQQVDESEADRQRETELLEQVQRKLDTNREEQANYRDVLNALEQIESDLAVVRRQQQRDLAVSRAVLLADQQKLTQLQLRIDQLELKVKRVRLDRGNVSASTRNLRQQRSALERRHKTLQHAIEINLELATAKLRESDE